MRFYVHHLLLAAVATQLPQVLAQEAQGGAEQHQVLHVARSEALVRARDAIAEAKVYHDAIVARAAAAEDAVLLAARGNKPSKPSKPNPAPAPAPATPATPPKIPKLKKCTKCGLMCPLGDNFHAHGPVLRFICEDLPGQKTK